MTVVRMAIFAPLGQCKSSRLKNLLSFVRNDVDRQLPATFSGAKLVAPQFLDPAKILGGEFNIGRRTILSHLPSIAAARNDDADRGVGDAEGNRRLRHGSVPLFQEAEFIHFRQLFLENLSGKVARPNILALKSLLILQLELAGKQTAAQRHPYDDPDVGLVSHGED